MIEWFPFLLSFKVAFITSFILLIIGILIAWILLSTKKSYKILVEVLILLPLVLPPTVLGFYLLLIFNQNSFLGKLFYSTFNYSLTFSQTGIIIASIIYSLPFMVQPIYSAFQQVPITLINKAKMLGKTDTIILLKVILPNSITGIISGCILSFMHTIGEFGVILMIGGNIPYKTQLISIKIYEEVETLNYNNAHIYSIILVIFSCIALLVVSYINKSKAKRV